MSKMSNQITRATELAMRTSEAVEMALLYSKDNPEESKELQKIAKLIHTIENRLIKLEIKQWKTIIPEQ
jgi:hypothetical protein